MGWAKSIKCTKLRGVQPLLYFWEPLVVVVRRGCGVIGVSESVICYLDKDLRWYMVESGYFKGFMLVY